MNFISMVKRLYNKFCNYFVMPSAFKDRIADKNMKRTVYGLVSTLFASIIAYGILCIATKDHIISKLQHKLFLQVYILTAVIAGVFLYIVWKCDIKSQILKQFPLYVCGTIGTLDCLFSLLRQTDVFNALVFFLFLEIIISILYTMHPFYFFLLTLYSYWKFHPMILKTYGSMGAYTTLLLFAVLVLLCLYKWMNQKRLFLREQNFELYKEALQSEVERQMEEITDQHNKIVAMQDHTIISLSNLVENRDSDTGHHVRRTSAYVRLLAEQARKDGYHTEILTVDNIKIFEKAAPMHDIGKIVVSDLILKKPGRLTEDEFKEMQRHAAEGGRIVLEVLGADQDKDYLNVACNIATSHHEKWDGSGYPYNLKGEDIPLSARIMAIADVFDALVSPRCYKEPFPPEKAFAIIEEDAGTHFDPYLAESFLKIKEPVLQVMHELTD